MKKRAFFAMVWAAAQYIPFFLLSAHLKMTGVWCAYPLTEFIVAWVGILYINKTKGSVEMNNPWNEIPLSDYENHMKLDSVHQLQTMNEMMQGQFDAYPVSCIMILGIAGGNALNISKKKNLNGYMA